MECEFEGNPEVTNVFWSVTEDGVTQDLSDGEETASDNIRASVDMNVSIFKEEVQIHVAEYLNQQKAFYMKYRKLFTPEFSHNSAAFASKLITNRFFNTASS